MSMWLSIISLRSCLLGCTTSTGTIVGFTSHDHTGETAQTYMLIQAQVQWICTWVAYSTANHHWVCGHKRITVSLSSFFFPYPHDCKGGGLILFILNFREETLFRCHIQIDFTHSPFMAWFLSSSLFLHVPGMYVIVISPTIDVGRPGHPRCCSRASPYPFHLL